MSFNNAKCGSLLFYFQVSHLVVNTSSTSLCTRGARHLPTLTQYEQIKVCQYNRTISRYTWKHFVVRSTTNDTSAMERVDAVHHATRIDFFHLNDLERQAMDRKSETVGDTAIGTMLLSLSGKSSMQPSLNSYSR